MSAAVDESVLKTCFHKRFCSYRHRHLCRERRNAVPELHSFVVEIRNSVPEVLNVILNVF